MMKSSGKPVNIAGDGKYDSPGRFSDFALILYMAHTEQYKILQHVLK